MRTKIQLSFHELPPESHKSLRDSLMEHISRIVENTNSVIVTQVLFFINNVFNSPNYCSRRFILNIIKPVVHPTVS